MSGPFARGQRGACRAHGALAVRRFRLGGSLAFPCLLALAAMGRAGESWPQFRGPDGQGHSDAVRLPLTWSETENIAWKTPIPGLGWSSPVIEGDQVWMTTALEQGKSLRAVCVARSTGKLLFDVEVFRIPQPENVNPKNTYASPTPVIEPGRVYVHFGTYGTACLDTADGRVVWRNQELKLDHKEGPGSSPILYRDLLIVNCDGMDVQYVVALDKATGRPRWKTERPSDLPENPDFRKAYSTPLVVRVAGRDELVSPGAQRVVAYDPQTGQQLWQVDHPGGFSNVARPIFGQGLWFINTGYPKAQLWAVKPGGRGDITASHVAWKVVKQVSKNPSPLLVGKRIYQVEDAGIATCLDAATGELLWAERLGGKFSASPLFADGRIYLCSEEGHTHVIQPADRFQRLAENVLDGRILASPAAAGNALFIRTDSHLYRIQRR